ncbi:MAG: purine-nucleoside phosphorylase, partial [Pirellulales bacterium]|nr:purine-nucleoside phosphorylase [Pirellulales bacterium]
MLDLYDKIEEATAAIRAQWSETPHVGIVLGTGLGLLGEIIDNRVIIDYEDVPHFACANSTSLRARLVCCSLQGLPVIA